MYVYELLHFLNCYFHLSNRKWLQPATVETLGREETIDSRKLQKTSKPWEKNKKRKKGKSGGTGKKRPPNPKKAHKKRRRRSGERGVKSVTRMRGRGVALRQRKGGGVVVRKRVGPRKGR